jgi:hypothetical protein
VSSMTYCYIVRSDSVLIPFPPAVGMVLNTMVLITAGRKANMMEDRYDLHDMFFTNPFYAEAVQMSTIWCSISLSLTPLSPSSPCHLKLAGDTPFRYGIIKYWSERSHCAVLGRFRQNVVATVNELLLLVYKLLLLEHKLLLIMQSNCKWKRTPQCLKSQNNTIHFQMEDIHNALDQKLTILPKRKSSFFRHF